MSLDGILEDLLDSRAQMWLITENPDGPLCGCAVTEIRGEVLNVRAIAGRGMYLWLDHLTSTLAKWGKEEGCLYLRASGRKGWVRVLEGHGFSPLCYTVQRRL